MTLKQIFSISLIISTSIVHAAAIESDEEILTFYTDGLLKSANIERKPPAVMHYIEANKKETLTGKTFKTLFSNACAKNLPWIIATNITQNPHSASLIVDYFDLTEILKAQAFHKTYDFSSHETTCETVTRALKKLFDKQDSTRTNLPIITTLHIIYYAAKHKMGFKARNTTTSHFIFTNAKDGTIAHTSDLSCTLAIALCNDYSQLVQLISNLDHSSDNYDKNQRLPFWENTFSSLPEEQQQQLIKECKDRLGISDQESDEIL